MHRSSAEMRQSMLNFEFYAPTKVVFGKNAENELGKLIKEQGCKKALVHYGGNSAKKSGLLDQIYKLLEEANISYVSLGGVVPNPRLSKVHEGIELCKKEGVDFILAVGGGSVIDSSKGIGYGVANDGEVWDFYEKTREPEGCTPIGAILTIAAAGSEMSNSSVITNEDGWLKRGCNSDTSRCKFAILNPELTYSLPDYQTASGCTDILMHTLERYLTTVEDTMLTDGIGEALMRTVIQSAKILVNDPNNYKARAEVMWASSLSHNGLTGCGSIGDWASHQLEHELGGMFDVAHGAGLAAIWGSWAGYVYKEKPERFAQLAVNVMGVPNNFLDSDKTAIAGICAMEEFFHSISMPTSLSELGVKLTDDQIDELAYKCTFENTRMIGGFKSLDIEDVKNIYRMAR